MDPPLSKGVVLGNLAHTLTFVTYCEAACQKTQKGINIFVYLRNKKDSIRNFRYFFFRRSRYKFCTDINFNFDMIQILYRIDFIFVTVQNLYSSLTQTASPQTASSYLNCINFSGLYRVKVWVRVRKIASVCRGLFRHFCEAILQKT